MFDFSKLRALLTPMPILYVASILAVNVGFSYFPPVVTPFGVLAPMAIVVGAIFVIRDFAQRQVGDLVIIPMIVGLILSYLMADPFVATASAAAFALSETADYLVYRFTKKPFRIRILLSSCVSVPVDSVVFLLVAGLFSGGTLMLMILSKAIAAVAVWAMTPPEMSGEPLVSRWGG